MRDFSRIIVVFLLVAIGCFAADSTVAEQPSIGDGSIASPYEVSNLAHLRWLSGENMTVAELEADQRYEKHYILTADIDASETNEWNSNGTYNNGFSPIADDSGYLNGVSISNYKGSYFTGSFDGGGHKISNLYMWRPNSEVVGFFGYLDTNAIVKNLTLDNTTIVGRMFTGGLAGRAYESRISNVNISGQLYGRNSVGGIIGSDKKSIIENSTIDLIIESNTFYSYSKTDNQSNIGGIIGYAVSTKISNCNIIGEIFGSEYVGGVVGRSATVLRITDSYVNVYIKNIDGFTVGGLIGYGRDSILVANNYVTGTVAGSFVGGLIGYSQARGSITNTHVSNNVYSRSNSHAMFIKSNTYVIMKNCYATGGTGFDFHASGSDITNQTLTYNSFIDTAKVLKEADLSTDYFLDSDFTSSLGMIAIPDSTNPWEHIENHRPHLYWEKNIITNNNAVLQSNDNKVSTFTISGYATLNGNSIIEQGVRYRNVGEDQWHVLKHGTLTGTGAFLMEFAVGNGFKYFVQPYFKESLKTFYGDMIQVDTKTYPVAPIGWSDGSGGFISNLAELRWLSETADAWDESWYLLKDIDAEESKYWNDKSTRYTYRDLTGAVYNIENFHGFSSIGTSGSFSGTFNGMNHTILNIYINQPEKDSVGLFAALDGALIKDLNISNITILGENQVGGLSGKSKSSTFLNIKMSSTVSGNDNVAGIVGYSYNDTISNIQINSSVDGNDYVGGLVGNLVSGLVKNCEITGSTLGSNKVGGFAGQIVSSSNIINSYTNSFVRGQTEVGGFAGLVYNLKPIITNSFSKSYTHGNKYTGGFIGNMQRGVVSNCYASGSTFGSQYVGGFTGYAPANSSSLDINNSFYDPQNNTSIRANGFILDDQRIISLEYQNFILYDFTTAFDIISIPDDDNPWVDNVSSRPHLYFQDNSVDNSYLASSTSSSLDIVGTLWNNTNVAEKGVAYLNIDNLELNYIKSTSADLDMTVSLPQNITYMVQSYVKDSLGNYYKGDAIRSTSKYSGGSGAINDKFIIANLEDLYQLSKSPNDWGANFIQVADIDALTTKEDDDFTPIGNEFNTFKGSYDGDGHKISNFYSKEQDANGLFGVVEGVEDSLQPKTFIKNLHLKDVEIIGPTIMGALIGVAYDTEISNCSSSGVIEYDSECYSSSSFYDCDFYRVGGLIGDLRSSKVSQSYSNATIIGKGIAGGLVALVTDDAVVSESYSNSQVLDLKKSSSVNKQGGLVGSLAGTIINSYTTSHVSRGGGIAGIAYETSVVINSYSASTFEPLSSSCNFAYSMYTGTTFENYFLDSTISNATRFTSSSFSLEFQPEKSTTEMYQQTTFENWDFENIWRIDENISYPTLAWQKVSFSSDLNVVATKDSSFTYTASTTSFYDPNLNISYLNIPSWLTLNGSTISGVTPLNAIDTIVTIVATTATDTSTVVLSIKINSAPTGLSLSNDSIYENEQPNFYIGELSVLDIDENDVHTYELSGVSALYFKIIEKYLYSAATFDFEQQYMYPLSITVTDSNNASYTTLDTIIIKDIESEEILSSSSQVSSSSSEILSSSSQVSSSSSEILSSSSDYITSTNLDFGMNFQYRDNILTLEFQYINQNQEIQVLDVMGNILFKERVNSTTVKLNMNNYTKGIYLIRATSNNVEFTKLLVIK